VAISAIAISVVTPKNGTAPADAAEKRTHERSGCDADAERGLIQHDGAREAAARRSDDDREAGRDEQGITEAPACPEADYLCDAPRASCQGAEHHDQDEPRHQCAFRPDPAADPAGDQHRHSSDDEVAGEQQLHLRRTRVQLACQ
jgi:hypothetical protein